MDRPAHASERRGPGEDRYEQVKSGKGTRSVGLCDLEDAIPVLAPVGRLTQQLKCFAIALEHLDHLVVCRNFGFWGFFHSEPRGGLLR